MLFRRSQIKTLDQCVAELLQLSGRVGGGEDTTEHLEQAVDFDAVDQAANGQRRLPVVQLGQLGRMQEQAKIRPRLDPSSPGCLVNAPQPS
jgi:hypothetical protein